MEDVGHQSAGVRGRLRETCLQLKCEREVASATTEEPSRQSEHDTCHTTQTDPMSHAVYISLVQGPSPHDMLTLINATPMVIQQF